MLSVTHDDTMKLYLSFIPCQSSSTILVTAHVSISFNLLNILRDSLGMKSIHYKASLPTQGMDFTATSRIWTHNPSAWVVHDCTP